MPGRTPPEAFTAFIEPLQSALACVVRGKLVISPGGRGTPDVQHSWVLGGHHGVPLGSSALALRARMHYRIVRDERDGMGPWRVTTEGYMYAVDSQEGAEFFSWHWHPDTSGSHTEPHQHFQSTVLSMSGSFLSRTPVPSGRLTFEALIRYLIESEQVEPLCPDWDARLTLAEGPHKLHRSWHNSPAERQI